MEKRRASPPALLQAWRHEPDQRSCQGQPCAPPYVAAYRHNQLNVNQLNLELKNWTKQRPGLKKALPGAWVTAHYRKGSQFVRGHWRRARQGR